MGAYTSSQLYTRLIALAMGLIGGLCQTVWAQVIGMNCGAIQIGEYVVHTECLAWTDLFLRYPQEATGAMGSVVLGGAIAGFVAGFGSMWRPRWAAILYAALALANLLMIFGAAATQDQYGKALALSALAVAAPLAAGLLLWQRGEYRAPTPSAVVADSER